MGQGAEGTKKKIQTTESRKTDITFRLPDLFKCGECGCMITAQYAKKGKVYLLQVLEKERKVPSTVPEQQSIDQTAKRRIAESICFRVLG